MDNCFPENRTALVGDSVSKAALHQYLLVSIAHQQVKSHRSLISIYVSESDRDFVVVPG